MSDGVAIRTHHSTNFREHMRHKLNIFVQTHGAEQQENLYIENMQIIKSGYMNWRCLEYLINTMFVKLTEASNHHYHFCAQFFTKPRE